MHECERMRAQISGLVAKVKSLASEVRSLKRQLEARA